MTSRMAHPTAMTIPTVQDISNPSFWPALTPAGRYEDTEENIRVNPGPGDFGCMTV
jgi:hypothetical protein